MHLGMELGIYVLRATVFLVTSKVKEESNIFWAKYNQSILYLGKKNAQLNIKHHI